jgi:hypothetical protein
MQHLDEGTIHAWLDGALSVEEAARAEAHVASCSACADAVAEVRGLIAASSRILTALDNVPNVRGAGEALEKRGKRAPGRRFITTWLVRERIAAVMALVVAGGALAVVLSRLGSPAASVQLAAEPVRTFEVAAADSPAPPPAPARDLRNGAQAMIGAGTAVAPASPARARDVTTTRQADTSSPPSLMQQDKPTVTSDAVVAASRTVDSVPPMRVAEAQREEAAERSAEGKSSVAEKVAGNLARRRAAETPTAFAEPRPMASSIGGAAGAASAQSAAAPSQGPRLVQEETMHEGGREVRRRIYMVENVLVTLDERLPSAANETRAPSANARPDSVQGISAITWIAANGHELTLTGPATKDRLERIRKALGY